MAAFCFGRGSRPANGGGTDDLVVPNDAPRRRRGYTPESNFLNASPPLYDFICFSLCKASLLLANSSV